ncbi:MAG: putative O-glycosylation ligase, exosortase A system-associated [Pseudomonadota bacterium]
MRDLILMAALLGVFPLILRAPAVGILTWIWVALMSPQREVYGFLHGFELNFYIAVFTAIAWIFSKERKTAPMNLVTAMVVLFGIWISITTLNAIHREFSYQYWDRTMKTLVLALAVMAIANTKARVQAVVWVTVLSLAFFGVKGGGFVLLTGGSHHVFGPEETMIADNNSLGLALVMILPLINYLRETSQKAWVRLCLMGAMGLTIVAVIGTYSRGALSAMAVMAVFYAIKSRAGFIPLVLGGLVILALPSLVPASWFERMSTINSYNADSSFAGRISAWRTSFNVAEERITGGGFSSINLNDVVRNYHSVGSLDTGLAAHSIYFQVLGDHGFIGLILFLMLLAAAWYNSAATLSFIRDKPELNWAAKLARMMQVSIVGYVIGGALLSMAYYDGFLIILALTGALLLTVKKPLTEDALGRVVPVWRRPVEQDMRALAKTSGAL